MRSSGGLSAFLIALIRGYQRFISPTLGRLGVRCRFHPTCSNYAILAIRKYGPLKGCAKTWDRLTRCRPDNFESCIDYP